MALDQIQRHSFGNEAIVDFYYCDVLTVSVVHFKNSKTGHVVPHHHSVESRGFVDTLDHLEISIREIQVGVVHGQAPRVRQPVNHSDAVRSVWVATLNLKKQTNVVESF